MTKTTQTAFDSITVNISTGAISYPEIKGFRLDVERVYRSAERFASHCPSVEMAIRHAIYEQLSAHRGQMSLGLAD